MTKKWIAILVTAVAAAMPSLADVWYDRECYRWVYRVCHQDSENSYIEIYNVEQKKFPGTDIDEFKKPTGELNIPRTIRGIPVTSFAGCSDCSGLESVLIPDCIENIGAWAFSGCTGLTDLSIPNSVTNIGDSAFSGCTGLTSMMIPNNVTSIGDSAFSGCTGLTEMTIPNNVTKIGNSAFYNCRGLTSVTILNRAMEIGDKAFYGCVGLVENDFIIVQNILFDYIRKAWDVEYDDVVIPDHVTRISAEVFAWYDQLRNITIPVGVTRIGDGAFRNCTGLEQVTFPVGVTSIGDFAFAECTGLKQVTISAGTTSIGTSAFAECTNLGVVVIPNSVTSIGASAFSGCDGLWSVALPLGLTRIQASTFSGCCSLDHMTIPDAVTDIGESAFSGCVYLTSITIPANVTNIGDSAFQNCEILQEVRFKGTPPTVGQDVFEGLYTEGCLGWIPSDVDGWDGIVSDTIWHGLLIKREDVPSFWIDGDVLKKVYPFNASSLRIPDGVRAIQSCAFEDCVGLTNITIPDSVTLIRSMAFSGCTGLTSMRIPSSVTTIEAAAFSGCRNLATITVDDGNPAYSSVDGLLLSKDGKTLVQGICGDVTIPDGVTSVGEGAFSGCGVTSVTMPSSITRIGDTAFSGSDTLTCVTFPNSVTSMGIEPFAFSGCTALESITLPYGVTEIGYQAFYDCIQLKRVTIPGTVTSIGECAFYNCDLENVTVPCSVTAIGDSAFWGCESLGQAILPTCFRENDNSDLFNYGRPSRLIYRDVHWYCVVFDANGGSGGCARHYQAGTSLSEMPQVSFPGYAFDGWWTESDGGTSVSDAETVTGDTTYYAHWTIIYTVTYAPGTYGTGSGWSENKARNETVCLSDWAFTRDGYRQTGWSTNPNGSTLDYDLGVAYTANASITLYPYWEADGGSGGGTYTVTYSPGVVGDGNEQIVTKMPGVPLTLAGAIFRESYGGEECTQIGWTTNDYYGAKAYDLGALYTEDASITLYPLWLWNVTAKFYARGGYGYMAPVTNQVCQYENDTYYTLPPCGFTRPGYTFAGWRVWDEGRHSLVADESLLPIYAAGESYGPLYNNGRLELAATWVENGGGSGSANPGFVFSGDADWFPDGNGVWRSGAIDIYRETAASLTVTGPGTISFTWKTSSDEYNDDRLKFYVDGGEVYGVEIRGETDWTTVTYAVQTTGETTLTWKYARGWGYGMSAWGWIKNVVWTPNGGSGGNGGDPDCHYSVGIRFNANGGFGDMGWVTVSVNGCSSDAYYTLPPCEFIRSGYTFAGWRIKDDCGLRNELYEPGYHYSLLCGDLELTAEWTEIDLSNIRTATANGLTWKYAVVNGEAVIFGGKYLEWDDEEGRDTWEYNTAIPQNASGAITIPSALGGYPVTAIGDGAFTECEGLTSVTIPSGILWIGEDAFSDCVRLTSVSLPEGLLSIGKEAFESCALTSLNLPQSLQVIGDRALGDCSNLRSVVIPESVQSIGYRAFQRCVSIWKAYVPNHLYARVWDNEVFRGTSAEIILLNAGETPSEQETVLQPWTAKKAVTLRGAVYDSENDVAGIVELKIAKPNVKKHNAKVSGSVTLMDGKKRTFKAVTVPCDGLSTIRVDKLIAKGINAFSLEIGANGFTGGNGTYTLQDVEVGGKWTREASVNGGWAEDGNLPAGTLTELLPEPENTELKAKGGKWVFAKAAKVKWGKLKTGGVGLTVDTSGGKTNLSALKLTYTQKTGVFKGSFKIYAVQGGKLKKFTVKVIGFVVEECGFGRATLAKPKTSWWLNVD